MSSTLERGALLHKRYRIVDILGQGGMGSVYHAVDENLGVDVAVKENLFTSDEYARQFRLEAVILANLRHPNLPRVTDHFVIGEQGQYLIMDYIEGEDLRQRMERLSAITEEEATPIGAAMCDALQYLHTRKPSIIHRDVKPGNVRIAPDGHIFLVDFGLAKLVKGSQATTTGARAMTPGYSPPEQYGTARTDPRTDIYSLGATLYAALTGVIPEDGLARAMDNVELTPLRKRNPKISRRLANAIEKAMAVRPEDRFQSAEEFKQALVTLNVRTQRLEGDFLVEPPPQSGGIEEDESPAEGLPPTEAGKALSRPPSKPRKKNGGKNRRWVSMSLFPLAILAMIALLVISWRPISKVFLTSQASSTPSLSTPSVIPVDTFTAQPHSGGPILPVDTVKPTNTLITPFLPSLTPSPTQTPGPTATLLGGGYSQVVFASTRNGIPQIYIINTDATGLRMLTDMPDGACQPAWSPDGLHLVFISPCPGRQDEYPGAKLYIINADGSGLAPLPFSTAGDFDPAWAPDGVHIAFTSRRSGLDQIYLMKLPDYKVTPLTKQSDDVTLPDWSKQPAWSPDGNQIAYTAHSRLTNTLQIWGMSKTGSNQERLFNSKTIYWDFLPNWSPDGKTILFNETIGHQVLGWLITFDYTNHRAAKPVPFAGHGEYSPDGRCVVYENLDIADPQSKYFYIYILRLEPLASPIRLTEFSANNFDPAWRPFSSP